MELSKAIRLIEKGIDRSDSAQRWVDLGAGDGLFTKALGSLLPIESLVLAIDQNERALKSIQWNFKSVALETQANNFNSTNWGEGFDGILMANSLHYVSNQLDFLSGLKTKLNRAGRLIVVEYERKQPNVWVPYPIDFEKLNMIGETAGFSSIIKLEATSSIYDGATIYSAVLM